MRKKKEKKETLANIFLEDLLSLQVSKKLNKNFYRFDLKQNRFYLWLSMAWRAWAIFYNELKGQPAPSQRTILYELKDNDYFIENKDGWLCFDLNKCPWQIRKMKQIDEGGSIFDDEADIMGK